MPDLPAITVTQTQLDRIVAAFPGTTPVEKAASYRAWLINRLIDRVLQVETAAVEQELRTLRTQKVQVILDSLPPRPSDPVGL